LKSEIRESTPLDSYAHCTAIAFNARCVWHHPGLAMAWGLLLAVCMLLTLLLALPLGLVVFPVLAYANFSSYRELAGPQENSS